MPLPLVRLGRSVTQMIHNEIRQCDFCGSAFSPVREAQRFCSKDCHDSYYPLERKRALAAWRAQQRGSLFFSDTQLLADDDDVCNQFREAG